MIRKILILIVLLSCSFNLSAQSYLQQVFDIELPVRIEHGNIETYFRLLETTIPTGVPVFMPKNIKNLTIYRWQTRSEFGKIVKTSMCKTYDATYKEGMLRTLRERGSGYITQYTFDGNLPISCVRYDIDSGVKVESGTPFYHNYRFASKGGVYILEGDFFDVDSNTTNGCYYNISTHSTYAKVEEIYWLCSKSYFIRNFGGISMYKVCKDGFSSLVNERYCKGYYDCVKDSSIRTVVYTHYINTIGLPTNIDAFECIRDGWYDEKGRYYYTYDYE